MRVPRSLQLINAIGFVHKFWRCHNREYYLALDKFKALYLNCIKSAMKIKEFRENVLIHSYCAMDNHFHQVIKYTHSSKIFSNFMRRVHSDFGRIYNRLNQRSGKVAEGRPKTPLIQDEDYLIQVQFYVEANPVRAKKIPLEKLKLYKYSSYRFYAFGICDEFTDILTPPNWYMDLGKTAKDRQRKYRKLFYKYLRDKGFEPNGFLEAFIGTSRWIYTEKQRIKKEVKCCDPNPASETNTS